MNVGSVDIVGEERLLAKLRSLEPKVSRAVTRKALRASAKLVQREAKSSAPVDSGTLRRNIRVRAAKKKRNRVAILIMVAGADFPDAFYGSFVELGTKKQPAQNYLDQAFDRTKTEARNLIIESIKSGIDEAVK